MESWYAYQISGSRKIRDKTQKSLAEMEFATASVAVPGKTI